MLRIVFGIILMCAASNARADDGGDFFDNYVKHPVGKYGRKGYDATKDWLARPYEPNAPPRRGLGAAGVPSIGMENRQQPPPGFGVVGTITIGLEGDDPANPKNWDKAQREQYAKAQAEEKKRLDEWHAQQQKQAADRAKEEQRNREAQNVIERDRQRAQQVEDEIDYNERTGNVANVSPYWDGPVIGDTPGRNLNPPRAPRDPFVTPSYTNPFPHVPFGPMSTAGGFSR